MGEITQVGENGSSGGSQVGAPNGGSSSSPGGGPGGSQDPPPPVMTPGVEPVSCDDYQTGPVFHRLNRTEYQNSVNGVLGTSLPLREDLPVDDLVNGFDNNGDVSTSTNLIQKYLNAANLAVKTALGDAALRQQLIPCDLGASDCAKKVLEDFLPKAFRRPVLASEVDEYLKYTGICKSSPEAGIGCALEAALVSPNFLYRSELLGPQAKDATCSPAAPLTSVGDNDLSPHAFASRLAYFITSGPPDEELLNLANSGKLSDPAVIAAQVERLLDSSNFARPFLDSMPSQWLLVDAITSAEPNKTAYPSWDEELRQALQAEARLFFAHLVKENASAVDLVRTDFTFLNERLAEHYGIDGVTGAQMRKVDTSGTARGGVLSQGAFLTATSSSENTSIVLRAKWVLNNILCTQIPPPPDGAAEEVPLPMGAEGLTNRESLEMRTANAPCSGCHETLNPLGFGLEVFDGIGARRNTQNGRTIDPSGTLPGAGSFTNAEEMFDLLKQDKRVPACITTKFMTYALGRDLSASCDKEALKALNDAFEKDGYKLKNHIIRIAQSELFRTARRR